MQIIIVYSAKSFKHPFILDPCDLIGAYAPFWGRFLDFRGFLILPAGSSGVGAGSACFPRFRVWGGLGSLTPLAPLFFLSLGVVFTFGDFFGFFALFCLQRALHVGRSGMF